MPAARGVDRMLRPGFSRKAQCKGREPDAEGVGLAPGWDFVLKAFRRCPDYGLGVGVGEWSGSGVGVGVGGSSGGLGTAVGSALAVGAGAGLAGAATWIWGVGEGG